MTRRCGNAWFALLACTAVAACDPGTRRPVYLPRPEAASTEVELPVPAATRALVDALHADSIPAERVATRDGFLESPWLDAGTLVPTKKRPLGPGVVKVRGWVDPGRHGYSQLTVEVVYRTSADPSSAARDLEREVAYASPARARVRAALQRIGGKPVDVPETAAPVPVPPRRRPDTALVAQRPAPNPIPSPVSVDSGTLNRGTRDSITSTAPAAAPNQGQRAAQTPSGQPAAAQATTPPARSTAAPASSASTSPAPSPATRTPTTPAPVRHYSVQVAAVRTSDEAAPVLTRLSGAGYAGRIDTESGWMKIRVGAYPDLAAAEAALQQIRARITQSAFLVRR
ncbi:MAG: SPOR domain-containing protein [Gemmatimonadales bacterium]|nr:SPOR domain-containing protein [Gemmatimonadales bacterium]